MMLLSLNIILVSLKRRYENFNSAASTNLSWQPTVERCTDKVRFIPKTKACQPDVVEGLIGDP